MKMPLRYSCQAALVYASMESLCHRASPAPLPEPPEPQNGRMCFAAYQKLPHGRVGTPMLGQAVKWGPRGGIFKKTSFSGQNAGIVSVFLIGSRVGNEVRGGG